MSPHAAAVVADTLKRNRALSAEFGAELSNHLSMGVVAMARLGASGGQIARFEALYRARNRLRPLAPAEREKAPATGLGDRTGEAERVEALRGEIRSSGREAVLRRHLTELVRGLAASAFHAMIRTACGIEADDDEEVAFGLAYWQATWLDLGAPTGGRGTEDPAAVLDAYGRYLRETGRVPAGRAIHPRMLLAATDPAFATFADRVRIGEGGLDQLAALARTVFARTLDFTALHLVTSTHALRVLTPWIEDLASANAAHWRAMLAGYAAMGAPPLAAEGAAADDGSDWNEVAALAIATGDDHAIKLAYSARCEAEAYGHDGAYRAMAAAYARRLASRA